MHPVRFVVYINHNHIRSFDLRGNNFFCKCANIFPLTSTFFEFILYNRRFAQVASLIFAGIHNPLLGFVHSFFKFLQLIFEIDLHSINRGYHLCDQSCRTNQVNLQFHAG